MQGMKKYIAAILIMNVFIIGCQTDPVRNSAGNPDDRLADILADYQNQLVNSTHGWKAFLYPGEGGGYNFYMQFSSENRVVMMADIIDETATEPFESSYRMAAVQRPSIFFDTYTYLHYLADPDPEVNGGIQGHGYLSDFEFAFESIAGDTIRLKGNQHDSELILVRASRREKEQYQSDRLQQIMSGIGNYVKDHPYLFLLAEDNKKTSVSINPYTRSASLVEQNGQGSDVVVSSTRFSYTTEGILLRDPLTFRGTSFRNIYRDIASNKLYIEGASDTRLDIKVLEGPIFPMHQVVGIEFISINLDPDPANSPGWSSTFKSTWISMDEALDGCCDFRLSDIQFLFNRETRAMDINMYVRDVSSGRSYRLRYPYAYTKTWDGIFTFFSNPNEEANYNAQYFRPVMENFLTEFENRKFRMEYIKTDKGFSGQMRSQDFLSFYFAGELR